MNDLLSFNFDLYPVRILTVDDAPWWIASDIAAILGYSHTPHMLRSLDEDEKGVHIADTLGGPQEVTIISESGLFAAILKSRRPEAKAFRRWVTGTVLPEIRRTGHWSAPGQGSGEPLPAPSLGTALLAVRTAQRLFGLAAARAVWSQLGLPPVSGAHNADEAALAARLAPVLAASASVTHDDCALALGLDPDDQPTRLALGRALRACGWSSRKERRPGHRHPVYVFRATAGEG